MALWLASCGVAPDTRVAEVPAFGSTAELQVRGASAAVADAALAEATAELRRLDHEWHPFEPSDVTRVNEAFAAGRAVDAPPSIVALVVRSQALSAESGGLFDPAVGGLIAAWGFHTSVFPVVSPAPGRDRIDAWRAARPRIGEVVVDGTRLSTRNRAMQLDFAAMPSEIAAKSSCIARLGVDGTRLSTPNRAMQLDFAAISEGMAADIVTGILRRHGIGQALVNLGGDVVAIGDARNLS